MRSIKTAHEGGRAPRSWQQEVVDTLDVLILEALMLFMIQKEILDKFREKDPDSDEHRYPN